MSKQYTVSELNSYIRNMFDTDFLLGRVTVKGEVGGCKYHGSGHVYFTLKDDESVIQAVMFAGDRRNGLDFKLETGMKVTVTGKISVYERDGKYQIYAKKIEKQGLGELYEKYLKLKQKLFEMGMFDEMYKRPIPKYIHTLGVVTASTGAAIGDILNVVKRRNPYVQIVFCPARTVEGDGAAENICRSIKTLDAYGTDVIILGRGGGSMESLLVFNEEIVAQAVFDCKTPVISAVGHERDYTITDYVADMRAPTPSAAAELAVFDVSIVERRLRETVSILGNRMRDRINSERVKLTNYTDKLKYLSPENKLNARRQHLDELTDRMDRIMKSRLETTRNRFT